MRPGPTASDVASAGWPPSDGAPFAGDVVVLGQRFANEDSGFAVLDCEWDGDRIVLVGPLVHLEPRERAAVAGTWTIDPRFGPQVRVREAHPVAPTDDAALLTYLRRVRHVGPRRAESLLAAYGADVLSAIDEDPRAAFARAGLKPGRAAEAARSWDALRTTRGLHLLLAPHGLAHVANRIHQHYGDRAYRVVRDRPYDLTSVFGVGFATADAIARGLGAPLDSPARARAALLHALAEAERDGSTCLPVPTLRARAGELLGHGAPPAEFLAELQEAGDVELETDDHGTWVYRAEIARLERELAERIQALLDGEPSSRLHAPETVPDAGAEGVELTDEQWAGVRGAFVHRLSVVTGGPGTGKTASIRMIGQIAAEQRAKLLLVAPTGRAALRMTEATGLDASTVHAALGWIPGEGPTHDADQPLSCDLVIVDETSMANLELLVTLLRAIGDGTHVVLVGDADQLAPVGAGKPFAELVASELVPTARLAHIFRQAAGSMIVQGAHAVRTGRAPSFARVEGMRQDLFLIARPDPVAAREEIVGLVSRRLPAHYGVDPVSDIQVFAPVYRGELGIDALNGSLRAALNADGAEVGNGRLRIGDKLMLVGRNLHDLGVMNGTLLRLLQELESDVDDEDEDDEAAPDELADIRGLRGGRRRGGGSGSGSGSGGGLLVSADSRAVIQIPQAEVGQLQLAYACSVHRGQGIELPIAIVVAHPAAGGRFLRREMLYTAITRSTIATIVVGTQEMVARAARTTDAGRRHSRLAERLG